MDVSLGVLYGLIPLFSWGIGDFIARKAIDREGYYKTLFFSQLVSALLLLAYLSLSPDFQDFSLYVAFLLLYIGVIWAVSGLAFYKSIEIGKLGIVSPVGASWAMITALLAIYFFEEELTQPMMAGVVLVLLGVVLASTSFSELRRIGKGRGVLKGVNYALVAMLCWGVMFALIKVVTDSLGPITPLLYFKAIALIVLFAAARPMKKKVSVPSKPSFLPIFLVGFLDTTAYIGLTYGIQTEYVSIVSPIAAAFPAVTVVLAYLFLKERFEFNQVIGILSIISGLVLLAVA